MTESAKSPLLAVAAHKIAKRAAETASPTQSGDSEDSVAAVQDARAPHSVHDPCADIRPWKPPKTAIDMIHGLQLRQQQEKRPRQAECQYAEDT